MAKTASFALIHFTVAFCVGYAITGSAVAGGAIALVEPAINSVAYFFHEMAWKQADVIRPVLAEAFACTAWVK